MDEAMRENVKKALINIYGEHVVNRWNINEAVANLLLEYIAEVGACDNSMGWVPRPWAPGKNPLKQLGKHLAGEIFKEAADKTPGCMNQAKNNFRLRFDDAGMGY